MTRRSDNLARKESREFQVDLGNSKSALDSQKTARKALLLLKTPKVWAQLLDVSEERVRQMKNGDAISKEQQRIIVESGKLEFLDTLNRLEDEFDRCLIENYGPNRDRGVF